MAQARKDYAYAVAGHNRSHDRNVAQKDADYQTGASLRERDYQNALTSLRLDPATGGLNYDGPDFMWKYVAWNFKPWAGVSQGTSGTVPDDIAQEVRYTVLAPFRWNQKDLDYWLATAAIDRQYATSAYNNSGYVSAKQSLLASYREQLQAEDEVYQLARAAAERTKTLADVQAHRTWVIGVEDEDVALAQLVEGHVNVLADTLKATEDGLSSSAGNAANGFVEDVNAARKDFDDTGAALDATRTIGNQEVNNDLTRSLQDAKNTLNEQSVDARGGYEQRLYTEHKQKLDNATVPNGAIQRLHALNVENAQSDTTHAIAMGAALNQHAQAISARQMALLDGGTLPDGAAVTGILPSVLARVTTEANADKTQALAHNAALKTRLDSEASARRSLTVIGRHAATAQAAADSKAEAKQLTSQAIARRQFQTLGENAAVIYATTVENARMAYWSDYESERFHPQNSSGYTTAHNNNLARAATRDAAIAAAEGPFAQSLHDAHVYYATAVGDALIVRAQEMGANRVLMAQANRTALTASASANADACQVYDAAEGPADRTNLSAKGSAERDYRITSASRNEFDKLGQGDETIELLEDILEANRQRSIDRAISEADFQIAEAQSRLVHLQAISAGQPTTSRPAFDTAQGAAWVSWLQQVKAAYIDWVDAVAQAQIEEAISLAEGNAGRDHARAVADTQYEQVAAPDDQLHALDVWDKTHQFALCASDNIGQQASANAIAEGDFGIGDAEAVSDSGVALAEADKAYRVALAELDTGDNIDPILQALTAAQAAAKLAYVTAQADNEVAFITAEAEAQRIYEKEESRALKQQALDVQPLQYQQELNRAEWDRDRQVSYAAAQIDVWDNQVAAANARRLAEAEAYVDFQSASYAAAAVVVPQIAQVVPLPWLQFRVQLAVTTSAWWNGSASPLYLQMIGTENQAETTYQATINTSYLAWANNAASYDETQRKEHALHFRDESADLLVTYETFADCVSDAAYEWQVARTDARREVQIAAVDMNAYDAPTGDPVANDEYFNDYIISDGNRLIGNALSAYARHHDDLFTDLAHAVAHAWALYNTTVAQANAEKTRIIAYANAEKAYDTNSSQTYAVAVDGLATSSPSPWATHYASVVDAIADYFAATSLAKADHDIAIADSVADHTIALASAQRDQTLGLKQAEFDDGDLVACAERDYVIIQATSAVEAATDSEDGWQWLLGQHGNGGNTPKGPAVRALPKAIASPEAKTPAEPNALPANKQPSEQPAKDSKELVNETADDKNRDNTFGDNLGQFKDAKRLGKLTSAQIKLAKSAIIDDTWMDHDWIEGKEITESSWVRWMSPEYKGTRNPNDTRPPSTGTFRALVGVESANGWIAISKHYGGGRTTRKALDSLAEQLNVASTSDPDEAIRIALATIRAPFSVSKGSSSFGIFIDGTGNSMESVTNVIRMYNIYQGSKAYYGGVGNFIDFVTVGKALGNAFGFGWKAILARAIDDIVTMRDEYLKTPGAKIDGFVVDIFGFSRGAAMAQDLAYLIHEEFFDGTLNKDLVNVRFLGLFDPVWSKGLPGVWGSYVEDRTTSLNGNRLLCPLPPNVIVCANLAATHEERTGFRATVTPTTSRRQTLYAFQIPGAHCEVGGWWGSNQFNQQIAFHAMYELARRSGVPVGPGDVVDDDVADYYQNYQEASANPLMRIEGKFVGNLRLSEDGRKLVREYLAVTGDARLWKPLSMEEFFGAIRDNRFASAWTPAALGFGVQKLGQNPALLPSPEGWRYQHYERKLTGAGYDYQKIAELYAETVRFKGFFDRLDKVRPRLNGDAGWEGSTLGGLDDEERH